jgi:glycosyltransferase involved in cell wall biosynthesis
MKLFEYMATGKAIVASDLPVLGEVLRNGENALIVPVSEIDAWEDAIRRLGSDEQMRIRLGRAARQECLSKYTWAGRADNVLAGLGREGEERSDRAGTVPAHQAAGLQEGIG